MGFRVVRWRTYWSTIMPKPRSITPTEESRIRECFKLDPGSPSGLTWKVRRRRSKVQAGDHAGYLRTQGCGHQGWSVGLDGQRYKAHNLIWLLLHGQWPADVWPLTIDHINRDGSDNSYDNLRLVSKSQQGANRAPYGTSLYRHVSWCKNARKFRAQWTHPVTKRFVYAGCHATELDAYHAALASRLENYDLLTGEWRL